MPAWFTIFCTRSIAHVTADDIWNAVTGDGLHMKAEECGIEDEEVEEAINQLRIEPPDGAEGVLAILRYGSSESRPVTILCWTETKEIYKELESAQKLLDEASGSEVEFVRAHLGQTVELVVVELGWSQLDDMGIVWADSVAEYFATIGDGLICDPHDNWWAIVDRCPVFLCRKEASS